ncbi:MAG: hypothetical protein HY000_12855 [Planctomycetes bacterium]|nr:hypothetical protein [Planctomycetota bacterium]
MTQASKVVEHQILLNMAEMTKIDGELMRMPANDPRRAEREGRLAIVKEATRGWQQRYFALTGVRWTSVEITEPLHVKVDGQKVWQEEQMRQANAYKSQVLPGVKKQMIEEYLGRITEVELKLQRLKEQVQFATKWPELTWQGIFEEFGRGYSENFVILERCIPWEVQTKMIPTAEAALEAAKRALEKEREGTQFKETHRNLVKAADVVNLGLAGMERYHNAMQDGGTIAIAYIKWGSIVITMPLTGAAGVAATGMGAVRVAVAGKAGEEGATLLARYLCGEKLSNDDLRKALAEVALAGGTAAAGEIAGQFAGPVATRIFGKNASPPQIDLVKEKLATVVSNNLEQAVKAVGNMMEGKPVDWDWWASAVAPALPPAAGAAVKEKDIRDGAAAAVK